MSFLTQSLLDTRPLSANDIYSLFRAADELAETFERHGSFFDPAKRMGEPSRIVCCLFFEPSTRTRMSFQTAAYRLGHQVLTMELFAGSSLSKGETYADTVLNIAAMKPDAMVIRYGRSPELDELLPGLQMPVLNAGSGSMAHPTQALLDAYTIYRRHGSLAGQKVLIVGDIRYSRVARSNFDVLRKLGAEIGVCGPEILMPEPDQLEGLHGIRVFRDLDEGIRWCTVYMGLRIQLERHEASDLKLASLDDYHKHFGLNRERLQFLSKDAMIMHPGPINHGVEFSNDVLDDSRSFVLEQVTNGVLIRAALLRELLSGRGQSYSTGRD
jgi:aspartate carbamoyltransferase catalytic subunit